MDDWLFACWPQFVMANRFKKVWSTPEFIAIGGMIWLKKIDLPCKRRPAVLLFYLYYWLADESL